MNERIRELAIQHGFIHEHMTTGEKNDAMNKFHRTAELIAKECISIIDELNAQYLASRKSTMDFDEKNIYAEGEAACDALKYKMKRHFGVEE